MTDWNSSDLFFSMQMRLAAFGRTQNVEPLCETQSSGDTAETQCSETNYLFMNWSENTLIAVHWLAVHCAPCVPLFDEIFSC